MRVVSPAGAEIFPLALGANEKFRVLIWTMRVCRNAHEQPEHDPQVLRHGRIEATPRGFEPRQTEPKADTIFYLRLKTLSRKPRFLLSETWFPRDLFASVVCTAMHSNARDFVILSEFCRMFCKTRRRGITSRDRHEEPRHLNEPLAQRRNRDRYHGRARSRRAGRKTIGDIT